MLTLDNFPSNFFQSADEFGTRSQFLLCFEACLGESVGRLGASTPRLPACPPAPRAGGEAQEDAVPERPVVVTTSTLEDWLFRGDDAIVAPMSFEVYSMWVFRIEKPHRRPDQQPLQGMPALHHVLVVLFTSTYCSRWVPSDDRPKHIAAATV